MARSFYGIINFTYLFRILLLVFLAGFSQFILPQKLFIAYTGNLNCNLEACDCETNQLGGMVFLATHLDSLRNHHSELILLDSGDFFNSYSLPEANTLMWDFLKELRYDAIGLGDQEFVEGKKFLNTLISNSFLPLVGTNLDIKNKLLEVNKYVIIQRSKIKIGILAVILPSSFSFIKLDTALLDQPEIKISKILDKLKGVTQFNILLLHDSFQSGLHFADRFPEIQVVITAHSQEKKCLQKENQLVTQAGFDGQYLGFLEITKTKENIDYFNKFLPVHSRLGEDCKFRRKIDQYYLRMDRN